MAGARHTLTSEYLEGRTIETLNKQLEARLWDLRHGKFWFADVVERLTSEIERRENAS